MEIIGHYYVGLFLQFLNRYQILTEVPMYNYLITNKSVLKIKIINRL